MKKSYSISIKEIRKIALRLFLKRKGVIVDLILIFGSLAVFIFCTILGIFIEDDLTKIAGTSLSFCIIGFIALSACIYVELFKKMPRKGNAIITYEYEFNDDNVMVKDLAKNKSFILNKQCIKEHFVIDNVLIVGETFYYMLPNDEEIKKALNLE